MERITFECGGLVRECLWRPPSGSGEPLVVFLHGKGATAAWADEETGWSRLAAAQGFALAVPEALRPHPTSPAKFLTNPQQWNDGTPGVVAGPPPADDVEFLAKVIDNVRLRSSIDPRRVYVCGFSNGAAMTFRLAADLAGQIAAIAPVAGYCWVKYPHPSRPVPTMYLIGSLDPLVPLRGGDVRSPWQHRFVQRPPVIDTLDRWARALGCATPSVPESESDQVRVDTYPGPVPFRVMTLKGLGHHWPGGKGGLNHRIAGPPLDAVNGTELIWEFLKQHRL